MSWTDEQIAEMQRHDDQVRHTVEKLKADRDAARAEAERLRDLFEASSQVAHELRAERDRLAEQISRVRDYTGHIERSGNTAYAKAGREILEIISPVAPALDGGETP